MTISLSPPQTAQNPVATQGTVQNQNTAPVQSAINITTGSSNQQNVTGATLYGSTPVQKPIRKISAVTNTTGGNTKRARPSKRLASKYQHTPKPVAVQQPDNNFTFANNEIIIPLDTDLSTKDKPAADQGFLSRVYDKTKGMIQHAISWLGTKYVWGGNSRRGIDCSGLTKALYAKEGIGLPHNARQQFKRGKAISKSALLPGDLVFFNTKGPISHVGIYIGNNQFLHASNPRRGVRIDSLSAPYYSRRFAGARRYRNLI